MVRSVHVTTTLGISQIHASEHGAWSMEHGAWSMEQHACATGDVEWSRDHAACGRCVVCHVSCIIHRVTSLPAASRNGYAPVATVNSINTTPATSDAVAVSVDDDDTPCCAICLVDMDVAAPRTQHMVCPCDHFFHTPCLMRWMEQKMECPTCRRALPPV